MDETAWLLGLPTSVTSVVVDEEIAAMVVSRVSDELATYSGETTVLSAEYDEIVETSPVSAGAGVVDVGANEVVELKADKVVAVES